MWPAQKRRKRAARPLKIEPAQMRDPSLWRRVKGYNLETDTEEEVVRHYHEGEWLDWVELKPSTHGLGAFALREHRAGDPVLPYFGVLVPLDEEPERTSTMVMQSGLEKFAVVGSPDSPSGAVYVNDRRGSGKQPNVKISVQLNVNKSIAEHEPLQFEAFHAAAVQSGESLVRPQAAGKVIPLFVAVKTIKPGTELLTRYDWTEKEWRDAIKSAALQGGGGSSSGDGAGAGAGSSSSGAGAGGSGGGGSSGGGGAGGGGGSSNSLIALPGYDNVLRIVERHGLQLRQLGDATALTEQGMTLQLLYRWVSDDELDTIRSTKRPAYQLATEGRDVLNVVLDKSKPVLYAWSALGTQGEEYRSARQPNLVVFALGKKGRPRHVAYEAASGKGMVVLKETPQKPTVVPLAFARKPIPNVD